MLTAVQGESIADIVLGIVTPVLTTQVVICTWPIDRCVLTVDLCGLLLLEELHVVSVMDYAPVNDEQNGTHGTINPAGFRAPLEVQG